MANRSNRAVPAKAGQYERVLMGMTQTAARYGYKDASVAKVVEQAGVSRATFYEYFADKARSFAQWKHVDAIMLADEAGVLTPERAATLLPALIAASPHRS